MPFDMPRVQEPQFPGLQMRITDFGAVGDGVTDNTQPFADAITEVAGKGGGTVLGGQSSEITLDVDKLDAAKCVFGQGASEEAVIWK